jgi:hypothetical protein
MGFNYAPGYAIPGIPWVTSSLASGIVRHDFPYVTEFFVVKNNSSGSMSVAFTQNGFASSNFISLLATESISAEVRIKTLYISGSAGQEYSLLAGLTTIQSRQMPTLSGALTPFSSSVYWEGIG